MSKKNNKEETPQVENPQDAAPQVAQPEAEQPKDEQPKDEAPETEQEEAEKPESEPKDQKQPAAYEPDYVKTLREKGVVVLSGRSRGELDEMLASIPADCSYYCGAVSYYYEKGLYRLQVNLK